jgi:unspecific monooxygenase
VVRALMAERQGADTARPADVLSAMVADADATAGACADRAAADSQIEAGIVAALQSSFGGTGVAAAWALMEAARRPEIERRARQEVAGTGNRSYIAAVIKETLRLHPPIWLMLRDVLRPIEIEGWPLRPGDRLMICPRLLHVDPRWWSAPEVFDPDRWQAPHPAGATTAYLPFGTGPRACPGARLATIQLVDGLAFLWGHTTVELHVANMSERFAALAYPARCHGSVRLSG